MDCGCGRKSMCHTRTGKVRRKGGCATCGGLSGGAEEVLDVPRGQQTGAITQEKFETDFVKETPELDMVVNKVGDALSKVTGNAVGSTQLKEFINDWLQDLVFKRSSAVFDDFLSGFLEGAIAYYKSSKVGRGAMTTIPLGLALQNLFTPPGPFKEETLRRMRIAMEGRVGPLPTDVAGKPSLYKMNHKGSSLLKEAVILDGREYTREASRVRSVVSSDYKMIPWNERGRWLDPYTGETRNFPPWSVSTYPVPTPEALTEIIVTGVTRRKLDVERAIQQEPDGRIVVKDRALLDTPIRAYFHDYEWTYIPNELLDELLLFQANTLFNGDLVESVSINEFDEMVLDPAFMTRKRSDYINDTDYKSLSAEGRKAFQEMVHLVDTTDPYMRPGQERARLNLAQQRFDTYLRAPLVKARKAEQEKREQAVEGQTTAAQDDKHARAFLNIDVLRSASGQLSSGVQALQTLLDTGADRVPGQFGEPGASPHAGQSRDGFKAFLPTASQLFYDRGKEFLEGKYITEPTLDYLPMPVPLIPSDKVLEFLGMTREEWGVTKFLKEWNRYVGNWGSESLDPAELARREQVMRERWELGGPVPVAGETPPLEPTKVAIPQTARNAYVYLKQQEAAGTPVDEETRVALEKQMGPFKEALMAGAGRQKTSTLHLTKMEGHGSPEALAYMEIDMGPISGAGRVPHHSWEAWYDQTSKSNVDKKMAMVRRRAAERTVKILPYTERPELLSDTFQVGPYGRNIHGQLSGGGTMKWRDVYVSDQLEGEPAEMVESMLQAVDLAFKRLDTRGHGTDQVKSLCDPGAEEPNALAGRAGGWEGLFHRALAHELKLYYDRNGLPHTYRLTPAEALHLVEFTRLYSAALAYYDRRKCPLRDGDPLAGFTEKQRKRVAEGIPPSLIMGIGYTRQQLLEEEKATERGDVGPKSQKARDEATVKQLLQDPKRKVYIDRLSAVANEYAKSYEAGDRATLKADYDETLAEYKKAFPDWDAVPVPELSTGPAPASPDIIRQMYDYMMTPAFRALPQAEKDAYKAHYEKQKKAQGVVSNPMATGSGRKKKAKLSGKGEGWGLDSMGWHWEPDSDAPAGFYKSYKKVVDLAFTRTQLAPSSRRGCWKADRGFTAGNCCDPGERQEYNMDLWVAVGDYYKANNLNSDTYVLTDAEALAVQDKVLRQRGCSTKGDGSVGLTPKQQHQLKMGVPLKRILGYDMSRDEILAQEKARVGEQSAESKAREEAAAKAQKEAAYTKEVERKNVASAAGGERAVFQETYGKTPEEVEKAFNDNDMALLDRLVAKAGHPTDYDPLYQAMVRALEEQTGSGKKGRRKAKLVPGGKPLPAKLDLSDAAIRKVAKAARSALRKKGGALVGGDWFNPSTWTLESVNPMNWSTEDWVNLAKGVDAAVFGPLSNPKVLSAAEAALVAGGTYTLPVVGTVGGATLAAMLHGAVLAHEYVYPPCSNGEGVLGCNDARDAVKETIDKAVQIAEVAGEHLPGVTDWLTNWADATMWEDPVGLGRKKKQPKGKGAYRGAFTRSTPGEDEESLFYYPKTLTPFGVSGVPEAGAESAAPSLPPL